MFNNNHFNNSSKNPQPSVKNPFTQEEVLQAWLENDVDYTKAKLQVKNTLQLNKSNKLMSFKDKYLQFIHLVTKNAVVASLIMFLAVGTLSASAAEVFAPNDYKPSTISKNIFNTNKQPDKDPYTALRTDDNNYVANLKACDISIKFPKQINGKNVEVYTDQRYQENTLINYFTLVDAYEFSPQYASQISRDEKPSIAFNSFNLNCGNFKTKFGEDYTQTKLTTDQLRNKTSWFVTENELSDIYDITGNFNSRVYEYKTILFTHKDIEYRIDYADPNYKGSDKQDLPGIFTNQIQIQFNSLVQNQDNKAVTEIPTKAGIQKNTPNIEPTVNPIQIELQKQGKLIKSENIIAQVQDDNGNPQVCGVKYVISYNDPIIDNDRNDFNSMSVTNNDLGFNLEQKTDYRNILGLLQRKIIYPDKNNYSRPQTSASSFLTPFLNSCGGDPFSYKFLEAPQVNYADTDSSITLYTLEGNGETGIPTVRIFAKKGDDLITISKTLFGYPYDLVAAECTIKTADGERIDNACYENALKRDPKLKTLLDAAAKDLVQTFAIKN
jgi:hypothetical protein